ncbi:hypothetical protein LCGC14_2087570 [marine sediment metagenome]|uniref:Uncharacterized protein n=1 Tax=marine sediment metagenome TaxID=412755 RepID=A0A0F9GRX5_9ZZZZ
MKYNYAKKHKIGDIIYPYFNGTAVWYKKSIWNVVTKIDKDKHWKSIKYFRSSETAELYSMIIKDKSKRGE